MAGRDVIATERSRLFPKVAELELLVAHHAGIRRAAGLVFARKIIDHQRVRIDLLRRPRNAESLANAPRSVHPRWPAGRSICPPRARCNPAARPSSSRRRRRSPARAAGSRRRWNRRHRSCRGGRAVSFGSFERVKSARTAGWSTPLPAFVILSRGDGEGPHNCKPRALWKRTPSLQLRGPMPRYAGSG